MVARQQHRLGPAGPHLPNYFGCIRPKRICQGDKAGGGAVQRKIYHRAALCCICSRLLHGRRRHLCPLLGQQGLCARRHMNPGHLSRHAAARKHGKGRWLCRRRAAGFAIPAHNRFSQRMFRAQLCPCRQRIQGLARPLRQNGAHFRYLRRAVCKRACFVKGYFGNRCQPFQRIALAHQKAILCGIANGRHNGRGRGKHQRAGAKHHQNCHSTQNFACHQPCQRCAGQCNHHNPGGPAVCKAYNFRLACICRLHQPHHALNGAILPHPGGAHIKGAELVHCSAGHFIPLRFIYRKRFACHHGLVNGRLPADNHAIHWDGLARQHAQHVAHLNCLCINRFLALRCNTARCARRKVHQLFNAGAGLCNGEVFQQAAQLHNKGHLARGKIFPNQHGCHQRQRHQHVGLDVERCHKANHSFQNDGHAA